jgi:hypothetical protein
MKKLIVLLLLFGSVSAFATNGVKRLMILQACGFSTIKPASPAFTTHYIPLQIPKIETPKGAVFCRLEDKLTKATKVWIKIGVK